MGTTPKSELFSPQSAPRRDTWSSSYSSRSSGWSSTQANALEQSLLATRLLSAEERTRDSRGDIGLSVFPGRQELFSQSAPAAALQQQFRTLRPEFIALHELGASWSRKFLRGMAAATGRTVQQLDIRREGSGTTLATVDYVECPTTHGGVLRIYSTDLPPSHTLDDATRQQVGFVLLAHARLSVVLVGDMASTGMHAAFGPLHQAMLEGPWPNRHMLLLPLTTAGALATVGTDLSDDTGVTVRTTPQVLRNADAWGFISGTWNRLRDELSHRGTGYAGQSVVLPELPGARRPASAQPAVQASSKDDMAALPASPEYSAPPSAPSSGLQAVADETRGLDALVEGISALAGCEACGIFQPRNEQAALPAIVKSGSTLALHGVTKERLAAQCHRWASQAAEGAQALGASAALESARFDLSNLHFFLRRLPGRPGLLLLAAFARDEQPMRYELQLRRLESELR